VAPIDRNQNTKNFAVLGSPIKHSLSPEIHRTFAKQTQQSLSYRAIELDQLGFDGFWQSDEAMALSGVNVTMPLKQLAFKHCNQHSERAQLAAAVNTMVRQPDGSFFGDNTDGIGLINDLHHNLNWPITDQHILLIGAGGAARGIIAPLLKQSCASLMIWNRTRSRAFELAEHFSTYGNVLGINSEALSHQKFDAVINAASSGHEGQNPKLNITLQKDAWAYDLSYGPAAFGFLNWMKQRQLKSSDGLGMLVEQAAASFQIWHQAKPLTGSVLAQLRRRF